VHRVCEGPGAGKDLSMRQVIDETCLHSFFVSLYRVGIDLC
jgi:hypothetical protein